MEENTPFQRDLDQDLAPEWLAVLRCPVTHQPLHWATPEEKKQHKVPLNQFALVTEDGSRLYSLRDGFPDLVPA